MAFIFTTGCAPTEDSRRLFLRLTCHLLENISGQVRPIILLYFAGVGAQKGAA